MATQTDYCRELDQIFTEESGRIGPEIFRRTNTNDAWNALVKQGQFPEGMGSILTSLTYERAIFNPASFTPMASSNVLTPSDQYVTANTPFQLISVPKSKLQYQLQRADFKSDDIALEDLRFGFQIEEQMENQLEQLSDAIRSIFTDYRRDEYTRLSAHKMIAAPGLPEDPTDFNNITAVPTTRMTQKIFDIIYQRLNRDGAKTYAMAQDQGRPVYMAILSTDQESAVLFDNPEIRKDFQFSAEVGTLLAPMGITRTYNGFMHTNDDFSPHWDYIAGVWVRRYPFDPTTGEISPLYDAAAFEDVFVFMQSVFTELVPDVMDGEGKAVYTAPQSYRGEWQWFNIRDAKCNPWGNTGFFGTRIITASKPGLPKHGYVIRVMRCPIDIGAVGCYGY